VPVHIAVGAVGCVVRRPHPQPWRSDVVIALNSLARYEDIDTMKHPTTGVIRHCVEIGGKTVEITPEQTATWRQLDYILTAGYDNVGLARELQRREANL